MAMIYTSKQVADRLGIKDIKSFFTIVHKLGIKPRTVPNRWHRWIFNDDEIKEIQTRMTSELRRKGDY